MERKDLFTGCFLLVFAALAFLGTYTFPETMIWGFAATEQPYTASASTWPRILACALMVLAVCLLGREFFRLKWGKVHETREKTPFGEDAARLAANKKRSLVFICLVFMYLLLLQYLGFSLAILFLGAACAMTLETGSFGKGKSLFAAVSLSVIIVVLFTKVMYLPLPRGTGIFRRFTEWLLFSL